VVQLITFAERKPPRHRLNALAIARADQPRHVQRTHPAPCLVPQSTQKRHEPTFKLVLPIRHPANHGRPLPKPTTHESQKNSFGNPVPLKTCQSRARPRTQLTRRGFGEEREILGAARALPVWTGGGHHPPAGRCCCTYDSISSRPACGKQARNNL